MKNIIRFNEEKAKRYVNLLHYIPWIVAVIEFIAFFVMACTMGEIMGSDSDFLNFLLMIICGLIASAVTFFSIRFVTAWMLLKIYYLQKIAYDPDKILQ